MNSHRLFVVLIICLLITSGELAAFHSAIIETIANGPLKLTALHSYSDAREQPTSLAAASTQLWEAKAKLTGAAGVQFDNWGQSVALRGNTAVIGGYHHIGSGTLSNPKGAASVFLHNQNGWTEQSLNPTDSDYEDFGAAVALNSDTVMVGAISSGGTVDPEPAVYVFARDGGGMWIQKQKLFASDHRAAVRFGISIAMSGDTAIIGSNNGAYVFVNASGTWTEQAHLTESDAATDFFGRSVAIDGNTAIVGAPQHQVGPNKAQGAAYAFVRSGTNWLPTNVFTATDGITGEYFGWSVAINKDTTVIGALLADVNGQRDQGAAYVFGRNGVAWDLKQKLTASDGVAWANFGSAVAVNGNSMVVGAYQARVTGSTDDKGAVYVFTGAGPSAFSEQQILRGTATKSLHFGNSLALDGGQLMVGAPWDYIETKQEQGEAYFFQLLDTDGDGLPDDWERNGVTFDGVFINLPAMGADPNHKDVFVHADWMQTDPSRPTVLFKPSARAIKMVIDAFAAVPADQANNPDLKRGINLHVDLGPDSMMNPLTGAKWGALSQAGDVPFQTATGTFNDPPLNTQYNWSAVDAIKAIHFGPSKRTAVFHYALFANTYGGSTSSGISRGIDGSDFLITLGTWSTPGGTVIQQAGTFMHEFGHNLNLHHGGDDELNYKPNYVSIMNYSFQLTGLLSPNGKRSLDYSRTTLPILTETSLDENAGISDPAGHLTLWKTYSRIDSPPGSNKCLANPNFYYKLFLPSSALDWNCDGTRTVGTVSADLNGDGACVGPGPNGVLDSTVVGDDVVISNLVTNGPNRTCNSAAQGDDRQIHAPGFVEPPLKSFRDWTALRFDGGGAIGSAGVDLPQPMNTTNDEATMEELLAFLPPSLVDEESTAPLDVVTVAPQEGIAPLTVNFDGSSSTALSGTITNWLWDFGDGTTGSGATVMHTYTTPGDYLASLTVTDSNGRVNLVSLLNRITVTTSAPSPSPTPVPSPTPTVSPTPSPTPTPPPGAGDVDPTYRPTVTGYGGEVNIVLTQPDGKILIGGYFEAFAGAAQRCIARINPDGSPDPTFHPELSVPVELRNGFVTALALQADGKILVGTVAPNDPASIPIIVRLNSDGSLDTSFNSPLASFGQRPEVDSIVMQADGRILVAGTFDYKNSNNVTRHGVARLNSDGSLDNSFDLTSGSPCGTVTGVLAQSDGKVMIGGSFVDSRTSQTCSGYLPRQAIARLNSNGSLDPGFEAGLHSLSRARNLILQPDGKILAEGLLDPDGTNSHNRNIARFDQSGTLENTFADIFPSITSSFDNIHGFALQQDGKVIAVGDFQITTPASRNNVLRLNSDGTLDVSFDTGTGTSGTTRVVSSVALQTNAQLLGKVIIGGRFENFNNLPAEQILQLNSDGSKDPQFSSNGPGFDNWTQAMVLQPDGKLLVGFVATSPTNSDNSKVNAFPRQAIGRINVDGSTDITFTSPFQHPGSSSNLVTSMALQQDGKIVVSGSFKLGAVNNYINLTRLNTDGSVDPTFVPYGFAGLGPVILQADGKIVTNGFGSGANIVRLNTDGSLDSTFGFFADFPSSTNRPNALAIQSDGKILVAGQFTQGCHNFQCFTRNDIARVNTDGSVDMTFDPGLGASGENDFVKTIAVQTDGKILVGGSFTSFNGTSRPGLARLNVDGSLDVSFVPVNANTFEQGTRPEPVSALALQADGKILVGCTYYYGGYANATPNRIFRLNPDGTPDATFNLRSGMEGASRNEVNGIIVQPDHSILVGGEFSTMNGFARLNLARLLPDATSPPPTPSPTPTPSPSASPTPTPSVTVQFVSPGFTVNEGAGHANLTVTRTGDVSAIASVDYETIDDASPVRCDVFGGTSYPRCDYSTTIDTLNFAAGETTKTFSVPIIDDSYAEGSETFSVLLTNARGMALGQRVTAQVTIIDNDSVNGSNPIFLTPFFVRQHYLDFLSREPEAGEPWSDILNNCSDINDDPTCDRLTVSAAFFDSPEFHLKGYFVYRLYKVAYNRRPDYAELIRAMRLVTGQTPSEVYAKKAAFIDKFVSQAQFSSFSLLSDDRYVETLLDQYGLTQITTPDPSAPDGTNKLTLTMQDVQNELRDGQLTRGQVLRAIADSDQVFTAEFNGAFVAMQYYGYLRRTPEPDGFNAWVQYLNAHPSDFRTMVNGFMNSIEYRLRFGP